MTATNGIANLVTSNYKLLTLEVSERSNKRFRLQITVDGKVQTFDGKRITVDNYTCVDSSPDGEATASGLLVQQAPITDWPWTQPVLSEEYVAVADPTPNISPKVGDLHDWDSLVDGCLYFDDECNDSKPYYYFLDEVGDWVDLQGTLDDVPGPDALGHKADKARVLAVGLPSLDAVKAAVCDNERVRETGGSL